MTLALQGVCAGYGTGDVIHDIELTVGAGEIVALVGANGAGKSTLVKTISGLIPARRGAISLDGARIDRDSARARVRLGVVQVPEGRQVFAGLSVRENLRLGAYARTRDAAPAQFADSMTAVGALFPALVPRFDEPAANLSGGQQQMLAISRALMANPDLMLLDEPSLGLSPKLTKEIFEIVVRINRERGTTILLVEQNANMALNAADYGHVLENGRIVMEDTCARLREKDDIREFYLGLKEDGVRGERRWKKKKTWR